MAVRANAVAQGTASFVEQTGGGINYLVQKPDGTLYCVYVSGTDTDVWWKKSLDGGLSWTRPVNIYVGSATALSVWYDRWSGIDADRIHIAYIESGTDDIRYRTLNAADDSLSTETVALAGTATAAGGCLSICRARGGNVYIAGSINGTTEGGFLRLPNANVPNGAWDAARANVLEGATTDQVILMPGFAADNQDMLALFIDASTNEFTRKVYDDSANSWAESTTVAITDVTPATSGPHWAATVDLTNSKVYVIFWNAVDAANQDLLCYRIDESEITARTAVVTDATDDCGKAALCLDQNGVLWAFWAGIVSGAQTWGTAVGLYAKTSADLGSTWSGVITISERVNHSVTQGVFDTVPRLFRGQPPLRFVDLLATNTPNLIVNSFIGSDPHGRYQMGM